MKDLYRVKKLAREVAGLPLIPEGGSSNSPRSPAVNVTLISLQDINIKSSPLDIEIFRQEHP